VRGARDVLHRRPRRPVAADFDLALLARVSVAEGRRVLRRRRRLRRRGQGRSGHARLRATASSRLRRRRRQSRRRPSGRRRGAFAPRRAGSRSRRSFPDALLCARTQGGAGRQPGVPRRLFRSQAGAGIDRHQSLDQRQRFRRQGHAQACVGGVYLHGQGQGRAARRSALALAVRRRALALAVRRSVRRRRRLAPGRREATHEHHVQHHAGGPAVRAEPVAAVLAPQRWKNLRSEIPARGVLADADGGAARQPEDRWAAGRWAGTYAVSGSEGGGGRRWRRRRRHRRTKQTY
jgi:hypothetical protein